MLMPVATTEQEPAERVQVPEGEKVASEKVNATVPAGDDPVTVAVQVLVAKTSKVVGLQMTVVVVVRAVMVRAAVLPTLPKLLESPL
jgi:hypothetical protein